MDDVLKRVEAMAVATSLWPREPAPGSGFAVDHAAAKAVSTYLVTRIQLLEAIRRLSTAGALVRQQREVDWGAHLVILRPALVLSAKAAWIVRPDASRERVARAIGMVMSDQQMGARAMKEAVAQGAPAAFASVGEAFRRTADVLGAGTPFEPVAPPKDVTLIHGLATDVDRYYGSADSGSTMQMLWNSSSGLAHGERWYSALVGGHKRSQLADTLTARSLDVVCSAINTTSLRLVWHASAPAV